MPSLNPCKMNRKTFIKQCGWACAGLALTPYLLSSCTTQALTVEAQFLSPYLTFEASKFDYIKDGKTLKRKYLIVYHERLQFPIAVFLKDNLFSAVWLKCPHQGAELQVFGDKLQCPAHGAEFSTTGTVLSPPADQNLRTFDVTLQDNLIQILMK